MNAWQAQCLHDMGLGPLWRLRQAGDLTDTPVKEVIEERSAVAVGNMTPQLRVSSETAPTPLDGEQGGRVSASSLTAPRSEQGDVFPASEARLPSVVSALPVPLARFVATDPRRDAQIMSMDWEALEASIRGCTACRLHEGRHLAVPGVGDRRARWLFVGEGPGAEEDRRGEPFVGAAGLLLDNMLAALGLKRGDDVYIANTVKCRPPNNRDPQEDEMAACHSYLERQIALLQPRVIVALGRPAAQALLARPVSIREVRGRRLARGGIALVVTYHPAYLLRNPAHKGRAWEDLCLARAILKEESVRL